MSQPANRLDAGDSSDLEALFDSVANRGTPGGQSSFAAPATADGGPDNSQDRVFNRVGQMMRQLNDTLRELGYDRVLQETAQAIPDAQERLAYVASLTEQAACRVLNATDIAMPIQDGLQAEARALGGRWNKLYANQLSVSEFTTLAGETRVFLEQQVPQKTEATNAQLMEIMMAQDFQDLTGQVIKKIVALAKDLETQLMHVLVDVIPNERRNSEVNSLLNGPVINPATSGEVAVTQGQVDDLLDSLGF